MLSLFPSRVVRHYALRKNSFTLYNWPNFITHFSRSIKLDSWRSWKVMYFQSLRYQNTGWHPQDIKIKHLLPLGHTISLLILKPRSSPIFLVVFLIFLNYTFRRKLNLTNWLMEYVFNLLFGHYFTQVFFFVSFCLPNCI